MRAAILVLATLYSTSSIANGYCESRDTPRAVMQCYDAIALPEVQKMKGLYEKYETTQPQPKRHYSNLNSTIKTGRGSWMRAAVTHAAAI